MHSRPALHYQANSELAQPLGVKPWLWTSISSSRMPRAGIAICFDCTRQNGIAKAHCCPSNTEFFRRQCETPAI